MYGFYPHRMAFLRNAKSRKTFLSFLKLRFPPHAHSDEYKMLVRAHDLTEELFQGEPRLRGEPYIEHPRRVALVAFERVGVRDANTIAACIMHDNREFAEAQGMVLWGSDQVENDFNYGVEVIVAACTAPHTQNGRSSAQAHSIYNRRFAVLAAQRILFEVKLPDRLDNLLTLSCDIMPRKKVIAKIIETEKYFLPAAKRHSILAPEMKKVLAWHRKRLNM